MGHRHLNLDNIHLNLEHIEIKLRNKLVITKKDVTFGKNVSVNSKGKKSSLLAGMCIEFLN